MMLFKILVILHTLGATVWTGGHLVLAVTVLPPALKHRDPTRIHQFEEHFEGFGLAALLLQVITGLWLTWTYFPGFENFWDFDSFLSVYIGIKLGLLLGTLTLAIHARFFIIPNLTKETLNSLAYHIVGVTTLAVLFVILGAGIRLGGFGLFLV
jgi:putative copper export protein